MGDCNTKTFVKVTNEDIFKKVCDLEEKMGAIDRKINVTRWMAGTSFTFSMIVIGVLVETKFL